MVVVGRAGYPAEVSVLESVGVAAEGDDFGVVDEPVDHGGGDDFVAEDFAPAIWNWLKLLQAETACGLGKGSPARLPLFEVREVFARCHLDSRGVKKVTRWIDLRCR